MSWYVVTRDSRHELKFRVGRLCLVESVTRDLRVNHHNESQLSFDEQLKAQPLRGVSEGAPQVSSAPFSMDPSIYAILNVDAVRTIHQQKCS